MKPRLLKFLVCPDCRGPLGFKLLKDKPVESEVSTSGVPAAAGHLDSILDGILLCDVCKWIFPVINGVPRMLTYRNGIWDEFQRLYPGVTSGHKGCRLPDGGAPPGEQNVLRTFSTEWVEYDWDEKAYWACTPEYLFKSMDWALNFNEFPVRGKLVLEVGIGIGATANHFVETRGCELIGVDLSFAVDPAYRHFGANPNFHIVQASIFKPPFREGTFDLAYSHGVLHHTYAPRKAFDSMASLVKPDGSAYVWLYGKACESGSILKRLQGFVESFTRPVITRMPNPVQTMALLPVVPLYLFYQNVIRRRARGAHAASWSLREAMHGARDRFTPQFASRHTRNEVARWFKDQGFSKLDTAIEREDKVDIPPEFYLNVSMRGSRVPSKIPDPSPQAKHRESSEPSRRTNTQ